MKLHNLPNPHPGKGEVLVRTYFSAISAGTEGRTVGDARKGYIAKARSRKDEVSKVVDAARKMGVAETYKMVMNKLEALQPLGYSNAGVVSAVGPGVSGFKPGDRVACGGASAAHAELVVVKENLVVKLPDGTPLDQAAFTTIGAIAMQGIRRADLKLGENCVVIGLGLIGQITVRLLKAAGVRSFGIDLREDLVEMAMQSGAEAAAERGNEQLQALVKAFTHGHGADAVIITAGTSSLDPVELAGELSRHHGKVVVVGNVPTGFSRKAYYRKELGLLMSTSYGPGRYDTNYEEKGMDYPIGQVRWTENRNMQAFVQLLGGGGFSLADMISHRYAFSDATSAFDLILDPAVQSMGVLLEYDTAKSLDFSVPETSRAVSTSVTVIGAGSFAGNFLLPHLKDAIDLDAVLTARPHTAEDARVKYGFAAAVTDMDAALGRKSGAVMIATRHDSHAPLALRALRAGKRVFVEKPLCLDMEAYAELAAQLRSAGSPDLMVGFNRRFAPLVQKAKLRLGALPVAMHYRINAGAMPPDHWVHDPEVGGGRLVGEACHFIDLCSFMAGSPITAVSAFAMHTDPQQLDTFTASLSFANGSIAGITYVSNGSKSLPKESIEIASGGLSICIDDFKSLRLYGKKAARARDGKQDKGHAAEMHAFAKAVKAGTPFPISTAESLHATLATFAVLESIRQGGVRIDLNDFENQWISAKSN